MRTKSTSQKLTHHVYVIELHPNVWKQRRKFREANPHFKGRRECLYVGMTSHLPQERFLKHKSGARSKKGFKISSRIVEQFGLYLRPSLYEPLNPMTKEDAVRIERELSESLRKRGYAVWWN